MAIEVTSNTDTPEAVTAAMGDLVKPVPVEEKKPEDKPKESVVEDPIDKPTDEIVDEAETEAEPSEEETKEESGEEVEAKAEDEKPKKKGGFQRKLEKQRQEIEYWKQEAMKKPAATDPVKVEAKPDLSKRPDASKFSSVDEYNDAVIEWKAEQILAKREQKFREDKAKNEVQARISKHQERVAEFSKSHDDWEEVTDAVKTVNLSLTVQEAILDSEDGAAIVYELAKDPGELKRICSLPPIAAARAIGRIEARLTKETPPSDKKVETKVAPKLVTPVRTKGTKITKDISDPEISQRDFERQRNAEIKARRESRY